MSSRIAGTILFVLALTGVAALPINAQSFRVQCPTSTITHPDLHNTGVNSKEPAYTGPTSLALGPGGYLAPSANVNGAIKCQQISGGDGYSTMADGTQTFMFSFGPLSGLADIANGLPGTEFPNVFNSIYSPNFATSGLALQPGDPATTDDSGGTSWPLGGTPAFSWNGAVGLTPDTDCLAEPTCASKIPASGLDGHVDEAAADVDGDGGVGHAVVERRCIRITVEMYCVLLEEIRPHDHAHVAESACCASSAE